MEGGASNMKRILISLTLGGVLLLGLSSVAMAKTGIGLYQLNAEMYPDTAPSASAFDITSQSSTRLRFLDDVLYPDVVASPLTWELPAGVCMINCGEY
jgi:hypothetical protein